MLHMGVDVVLHTGWVYSLRGMLFVFICDGLYRRGLVIEMSVADRHHFVLFE